MKVGDKLTCKCNVEWRGSAIIKSFYAGNEYTIQECPNVEKYKIGYFLSINTDKDIGLWFSSTNVSKEMVYKYYIWDYFYSPQEIRKIKINKINESRR